MKARHSRDLVCEQRSDALHDRTRQDRERTAQDRAQMRHAMVQGDPLPPISPRYLSIAAVAEMFGRSPRTIRSWIQAGLLRRIRVGRAVFIPSTEIDRLLTESSTNRTND